MSTSTGEKGWCSYCPHSLDQHTKAKSSKCKKCRKRFLICQCGLHGHERDDRVNSAGWRICYRPCSCGKQYYPDTASAATELEPWEYILDHEAYRPVDDFFEDDTTQQLLDPSVLELQVDGQVEGHYFETHEVYDEVVQDELGDLTAQFRQFAIQDDAAGPSNEPVYVDTYLRKGKHVYFTHGDVEYKTSKNEWEWHQRAGESGKVVYHCEYQRGGTVFWTYELPGAEPDEDYVETGGKGKGREKGKAKAKGKGKQR